MDLTPEVGVSMNSIEDDAICHATVASQFDGRTRFGQMWRCEQ
jgi:hypothetical protein